MVYKIGVFKNFAKFTEKPLCQCEIFKSTFFYRAPLVVPSDFSIKNYKWQYINFIRKSIKVFVRLVISYVTKSNFSAKKCMSKVNNNDTRMTSIKVVLVFLLLTLNTLHMNPKYFPGGIYLLKVNSGNTSNKHDICSKFAIKTPERSQWRCPVVFVNFGKIHTCCGVFIVDFEQVPVGMMFTLQVYSLFFEITPIIEITKKKVWASPM